MPQDGIRRIVLRELEAAAVRHFHLWLVEQKAVIRAQRIRAATQVFADERQFVEYRIERPQRQAKSALAAGRAVAGAAVAALFGEGSEHFVLK